MPAGRSRVKNPVDRIIDRAKAEIVPPGAADRASAANGGFSGLSVTAIETTKAGTDEDGNIITQYPMMWDVDDWDNPNTFW